MKLILITGTTRGLGYELSKKILNYRDNEDMLFCLNRKKQLNIEELNYNNYYIDLSNINEVSNFNVYIENILDSKKYDEVIFINNAAILGEISNIGNLCKDNIIESFNINSIAPISIVNNLLKIVNDLEISLKIINITSGVIFNNIEGWSLYSSTKLSFYNFLNNLELEQLNRNVAIVSFDPGVMNTDMQREIRSIDSTKFGFVEEFRQYKVKNNLIEPEIVAEIIIENFVYKWNTQKSYHRVYDYLK